MNATTVSNRAPERPLLARFFTSWPVVCTAVSAVFLGTVYLLGDFHMHPAPGQPGQPLAPASALQQDIRQIASPPATRDQPLLAVAHNPVAILADSQLAT